MYMDKGIDTGTLVFSVIFKPKAGFPELKKSYDFAQEYDYSLTSFDSFGGVLDSDSSSSKENLNNVNNNEVH